MSYFRLAIKTEPLHLFQSGKSGYSKRFFNELIITFVILKVRYSEYTIRLVIPKCRYSE